jgi:hypothetical protein
MATNHRGQEIHAGKRTTDAIRSWSMGEGGRQTAHISEDLAFDRGDEPYRMVGSVKPNERGRWDALLERPHDYSAYGTSWAEGSLAIERNHVNNRLGSIPSPMGDYRTEKRAKMAVSAMANRRNEGRDPQTGRGPSYPKGSRPGRPY